jgi:hypothetical protein
MPRRPHFSLDTPFGLILVAGILAVCAGWAQNPDQLEPAPLEPGTQLRGEPGEAGQPRDCAGGYTTTQCSFENEKFVRTFTIGAAIASAAAALVVPFLAAVVWLKKMRWWRANPWLRWAWPTVVGLAIAAILLCGLPFLTSRGKLPPWVGLLVYFGVRDDFFISCAPCSASVSNYPPWFGWFGQFGMPEMGLAIEQPWSLLLSLVLGFLLFSLIFGGIHWAWRRLRGFRRLAAEREVS